MSENCPEGMGLREAEVGENSHMNLAPTTTQVMMSKSKFKNGGGKMSASMFGTWRPKEWWTCWCSKMHQLAHLEFCIKGSAVCRLISVCDIPQEGFLLSEHCMVCVRVHVCIDTLHKITQA